MLPMRLFRSRRFAATNGLSFAMFFGTFGAIFLLSQFFQTAQGYGPFEAGARTLPWTAMPMFVAPIAGLLSDRIGTRPLMTAGLALQAIGLGWIALITDPSTSFASFVPPFVLAGSGMALVFPTAAASVLSSVRPDEAGKASGANNAIREIGGVMGVAVLASVFSANGGYGSPTSFNDGIVAALPIAVVVLAVGVVLGLMVPRESKRTREAEGPATAEGASGHRLTATTADWWRQAPRIRLGSGGTSSSTAIARRSATNLPGGTPSTRRTSAPLASRKTRSSGKRMPTVWTLRQRGISRPGPARSRGRKARPSRRHSNPLATGTRTPGDLAGGERGEAIGGVHDPIQPRDPWPPP